MSLAFSSGRMGFAFGIVVGGVNEEGGTLYLFYFVRPVYVAQAAGGLQNFGQVTARGDAAGVGWPHVGLIVRLHGIIPEGDVGGCLYLINICLPTRVFGIQMGKAVSQQLGRTWVQLGGCIQYHQLAYALRVVGGKVDAEEAAKGMTTEDNLIQPQRVEETEDIIGMVGHGVVEGRMVAKATAAEVDTVEREVFGEACGCYTIKGMGIGSNTVHEEHGGAAVALIGYVVKVDVIDRDVVVGIVHGS